MSDIFISYSKIDHALALKLSAFLESEGWTVWWDKSLAAADLYRDEIMKQLVAARAVITIWSSNSVRSDWVRAEAGRAKADGKLIPVKTPDLTYGDIPLPFGEMHTENVGSTELIRAAVVAQLGKPVIPQSPLWQITSTFKYQVLTWVGIVGSAITLFGNLGSVLDLADWAKELVARWHEWNQTIWGWLFSLIRVKLPTEVVPIISFTVYTVILVVGVNLSTENESSLYTSRLVNSKARKVGIYFVGVLLYVTALVAFYAAGNAIPGGVPTRIAAFMVIVGVPLGYLLYVIRERVWGIVASLLFFVMVGCLLIVPTLAVWAEDEIVGLIILAISAALVPILWMGVILFSPLITDDV